MERLADVELQLCMHGLEAKELLQFARCSRRMMQRASSAFAWKFSVLRLDSSKLLARKAPLTGLLLRVAPVSLTLSFSFGDEAPKELAPLQVALRPFHVLHGLDVWQSDTVHFRDVMAWPQFQQLRVLILRGLPSRPPLDERCVELIRAMPQLHTLHLRKTRSLEDALSALVAAMATSHTITDLRLEDNTEANGTSSSSSGGSSAPSSSSSNSLMPLLNQFKLKRLCVVRPMLYGSAFKEFCTLPNIAENLQRLEIEHFFAAGNESRGLVAVPAVDYASSFLALRNLRCLQLRRVLNLDALLPHLVHAASLTDLLLEPSVENAWAAQGLLPSAAVIYSLLSACERLHVRLRR